MLFLIQYTAYMMRGSSIKTNEKETGLPLPDLEEEDL
jgi:hypothetical protein